MCRLKKAHTGEYLAKELAACLEAFEIILKVRPLILCYVIVILHGDFLHSLWD